MCETDKPSLISSVWTFFFLHGIVVSPSILQSYSFLCSSSKRMCFKTEAHKIAEKSEALVRHHSWWFSSTCCEKRGSGWNAMSAAQRCSTNTNPHQKQCFPSGDQGAHSSEILWQLGPMRCMWQMAHVVGRRKPSQSPQKMVILTIQRKWMSY